MFFSSYISGKSYLWFSPLWAPKNILDQNQFNPKPKNQKQLAKIFGGLSNLDSWYNIQLALSNNLQ